MCAKDDLIRRKGLLLTSTQTWEVLFQTYNRRLAGELATAESVTAKDPNYVDTFGSDFAFSFAAWLQRIKCTLGDVDSLFADNILSLIAFIISYRLFADELRLTPSTLLAGFIPTTKIRDPLLKTDYEEQVLLTSVKKNRYCMRCTRTEQFTRLQQERCLDKGHDDFVYLVDCFGWKHYNFNIHVSLATDTLHLLLKGLLVAVVSLLFVLKAPFALHFIRAVCDLVILAQYKNIRMYRALDSICTRVNSEAHYITIVKQFYSMTNKKEVIRSLPFRRLGWLIPGIQPHSIKLPLSEVAANIAISNFIHAAARSSGKRHNDPEYCNEEVVRCAPNWQQTGLWRRDYLYLILTIIDYTCYDKDGKHMAYIRAFSEVLLFNNNGQIDNTTGMLSVRRRAWNAASKRRTLQAFKFYDLSTIIRLVHLVLRDLPNSTTRTTMSYYVNNYIDWDEYNRLYSLTFNIDLLRTLREYRRKRT
ncbi:hypothetical protein HBI74_241100 [Parastagonospora nodorum]|nr:hypothetical protein HBI74_241100 [Parastagonospora nodorum]